MKCYLKIILLCILQNFIKTYAISLVINENNLKQKVLCENVAKQQKNIINQHEQQQPLNNFNHVQKTKINANSTVYIFKTLEDISNLINTILFNHRYDPEASSTNVIGHINQLKTTNLTTITNDTAPLYLHPLVSAPNTPNTTTTTTMAKQFEILPFNIWDSLKLEQLKLEQAQANERKPSKRKKKTKKKKKKKKQKNPKKKKQKKPTTVGQVAQVIFAKPTTHKPWHYQPHPTAWPATPTATARPTRKKKIKYIIRKKSALKKKKKEYLSHLGYVLYPFVKFVAFFTVLNPFTLGVFLFSLISPVVFGFLGFMALSFLVKPALHLLFDVKRRVGVINRKKWREHRRRERLRKSHRPITIHKHYYKYQQWAPPPPKHQHHATHYAPVIIKHNPILPHVKTKLQHGAGGAVKPQFIRYEKVNYDTDRFAQTANKDVFL